MEPIAERRGEPVHEELAALLLAALEKEPESRPASAAVFRRRLLELDVPAWTEAEAEAWWRTHREAVEERRKAERVGPRATLAVDLAYRS